MSRDHRNAVAVLAILLTTRIAIAQNGPNEADVPTTSSSSPTGLPFRAGDDPSRCLVALSLREDYFARFVRPDGSTAAEYRTRFGIGLRFERSWSRSDAGIASDLDAAHDLRAGKTHIGYGNLFGHYGYRWKRAMFMLTQSFRRGDDPIDASASTVRQVRAPYLQTTSAAGLSYLVSERTVWQVGYGFGFVHRDAETGGDALQNSLLASLKHQAGERLSGQVSYTLRRSGDDLAADSLAHAATGSLRYTLSRKNTVLLDLGGTSLDRTDPGLDTLSYQARLGFQRQLSPELVLIVSAGVTGLNDEDGRNQVFPSWQASLAGALPLLRTARTSLRLTGSQRIEDTTSDVENVGMALRQTATLALDHEISDRSQASFFTTVTRTKVLESTGATSAVSGQEASTLSAGASAAFALGRRFTLDLGLRRIQYLAGRIAATSGENRATAGIATSFALF